MHNLDCPRIASLPEVIEHRQTCPMCRALSAPAGSLRWWAVELCRATGHPYDEELEGYLDAPETVWLLTHDPAKRPKMWIAHLAGYLVHRAALIGQK